MQLLLRKVKPQWTAETFKTVSFTTHGDEQKEGQLRELGQGAFTGNVTAIGTLALELTPDLLHE